MCCSFREFLQKQYFRSQILVTFSDHQGMSEILPTLCNHFEGYLNVFQLPSVFTVLPFSF